MGPSWVFPVISDVKQCQVYIPSRRLRLSSGWGPGLLALPSQPVSPALQVVDVAPELLRICSLILAENKIPPGELGAVGRGGGRGGQLGTYRPGLPALSLFALHTDTKATLLLLLTFLARQHTDSFHSALGSLPGDKAQELQAALGLT